MGKSQSKGSKMGLNATFCMAVGGMAVGGMAVGGMAVGGMAVGGMAVGGMAVGGMAVGGMAVGGMAVGGIFSFGFGRRRAVGRAIGLAGVRVRRTYRFSDSVLTRTWRIYLVEATALSAFCARSA